MAFESLDDAMFWHGSLIGYMAGVKSACKDEDKSSLLLRMADIQARLEFMESENAKLRELASVLAHCAANSACDGCPINGGCARVGEFDLCATVHDRMCELRIEVNG